MAIINSLAIGKSVKSAGNLTYKTVRGRTIASQRITTNKSNTLLQASQRSAFGMAAKVATIMQSYINATYEKSKYGSARNNFMAINKGYTLQGLYPEVSEGTIPLSDVFVPSFKQPYESFDTLRYSAYGTSSVIAKENYEVKEWTDSAFNNFNVKFTVSLDFILPAPVSPEKAEFVVAGLIPSEGQAANQVGFTSKVYDLTAESIAELKKLGFNVTLTQDVTTLAISAINVVSVGAAMFEGYTAYCVAFPRVSSKIPKLSSIFELKQASV